MVRLAAAGVRGLVRLPHDEAEWKRVTLDFGNFLRQGKTTVRISIANRTLHEDMQEKIENALMPLFLRQAISFLIMWRTGGNRRTGLGGQALMQPGLVPFRFFPDQGPIRAWPPGTGPDRRIPGQTGGVFCGRWW